MRRALVAAGAAAVLGAATYAGSSLLAPGCLSSSSTVIVIDLDNERHDDVLDHAWDAVDAGRPELLHLEREGADENRDQSLAGIPTRPGYDRDEYPPAVSAEGGAGASVRYVESSENRSAGSVMGRQLSGWCDGQVFRYEGEP